MSRMIGRTEPRAGTLLCGAPFAYLFIGYDGQYYLCCSDWKKETPMGSVFDESFHSVTAKKLAYLQSLADAESRPEISGGTDPKTQMYKVLSGTKRIGSNGGTLAGLVGSYAQVVDRIQAFHDAGIELFMLQFQPIEAELDRFADKIIPHFS
jgi:hypothetical protein